MLETVPEPGQGRLRGSPLGREGNSMSLQLVPALALFMGMVLVACTYGVAVAGHFPTDHRAERFRNAVGVAVLWGTIAIVMLTAVLALYFAYRTLPWYAAVIGGGFMALGAPFLCLPLSDRVVNSRAILLGLAATALMLDAVVFCLIH
jgi:hypothetical protein